MNCDICGGFVDELLYLWWICGYILLLKFLLILFFSQKYLFSVARKQAAENNRLNYFRRLRDIRRKYVIFGGMGLADKIIFGYFFGGQEPPKINLMPPKISYFAA